VALPGRVSLVAGVLRGCTAAFLRISPRSFSDQGHDEFDGQPELSLVQESIGRPRSTLHNANDLPALVILFFYRFQDRVSRFSGPIKLSIP
jgi:hypothetical protein